MKQDKTNPLRLSIKALSSSLESTGAPQSVASRQAPEAQATPQQFAATTTATPAAKDDYKEIKSTSQLKMASLGLQKALEQWDTLDIGDRKQSPNEKALEDMKVLLKELKEKLAQFE